MNSCYYVRLHGITHVVGCDIFLWWRVILYRRAVGGGTGSSTSKLPPELEGDEQLKNIEPKMVEMIMNEVGNNLL